MFILPPSSFLLVIISLLIPSAIQAYSLFDFGRNNKPTSASGNDELKDSQQQTQLHHHGQRNRSEKKLQHRRRTEDDEYGDDDDGGIKTKRRNLQISTEESTLSTGLFHTCAIIYRAGVHHQDDTSCGGKSSSSSSSCGPVKCWGQNNFGQASPPPGVLFRQLSSGGFFTCGLKVDGSVACWGDIDHPPKSLEMLSSEERANVEHARRMRQNEEEGRRGGGGGGGGGSGRPVNGGGHHNVQVSSGLKHACAISLDSEVHCWGRNDYGESSPPSGKFIQVSAGHSFTCGIRSNGAVKCWGKNDVGQSSPPPYPKYAFQQVSASVGGDHACGVLTENGAIRCWGNNGRGQSENQDGNFRQVSAGTRTTCAIRVETGTPTDDGNDNGTSSSTAIHCWGSRASTLLDHFDIDRRKNNVSNKEDDDDHRHSQISLGQDHACASAKKTAVVDGASDASRNSLQCWWMAGSDFDAHRVPVGLEMVA